jgi:hypothetical protein
MKRSLSLLVVGTFALGTIRTATADVDFSKDVKPILESTCVRCHGAQKSKGKLRLDTRDGLMKGSENGPVIVPGKPDESKLFQLASQPKSSEDRMPPEGEPLAKAQVETLKKWIAEGAKWPEGLVLNSAAGAGSKDNSAAPPAKDDPGLPISESEKSAVTKLLNAGVLALRLAQNTNLLRVDFSLRGKDVKDDELAILKDIPNLTELNLGGTVVNDVGLAHLKPLTRLTRLGLQNTKITDAGLPNLVGMTKLTSLNIYGTAVTDKGLESLMQLKSLKRLYVWQTKVTKDGAKKLADSTKGLDVELGYEAPPAEPVKAKTPPKK